MLRAALACPLLVAQAAACAADCGTTGIEAGEPDAAAVDLDSGAVDAVVQVDSTAARDAPMVDDRQTADHAPLLHDGATADRATPDTAEPDAATPDTATPDAVAPDALAVDATRPAIPLAQVIAEAGLQALLHSGDAANLSIDRLVAGAPVFGLRARSFACQPGSAAGCEPDRYEVQLAGSQFQIYGLGMQASANQVALADFIDGSFGFGHLVVPGIPSDQSFESDIGRLRTPVFVIPEQGLIVAYLQPALKKLRLTRDGSNQCPTATTCLVLKKHEQYAEGAPAELLLVKGDDVAQAYARYAEQLKRRRDFRPPQRSTFGVAWETFGEFGCTADRASILAAADQYQNAGIRLSLLAIGSGYWNSDSSVGCAVAENNEPATDTLVVHATRYGSKADLEALFGTLLGRGILPLIGMRSQIRQGADGGNFERIRLAFAARGLQSSPFLDDNLYYANAGDASHRVRLLNTFDARVVATWVDLLREGDGGANPGYASNFMGIKDDDMNFTDQRRQIPAAAANLRDDLTSAAYPIYRQRLGGNAIILGRNDWFGVATDGQNPQGWLKWYPAPGVYDAKYWLDSSLTQVISGYPHPTSEISSRSFGAAGSDIPDASAKEFLRTQQLMTFYGVTLLSRGFWHLPEGALRSAAVYYGRLRNRLQQYAYDQAMRWYESGLPWLMQPLFVRWPGDPNAHANYAAPDAQDPACADRPCNEYMFGNALLVRPVFSYDDTVAVYLPAGQWRAFFKPAGPYTGPTTIGYEIDPGNASDYPVFLKGGEILLIFDAVDANVLWAYVVLDGDGASASYRMHQPSGAVVDLQARRSGDSVTLQRLDSGATAAMIRDSYGKGFWQVALSSLGL